MIVVLQLTAMLVLISLGAFFSGSETGVYRLSRFKLRLGIEHGRPFYKLLGKVVSDSRSLVVSILLGNNLANYAVTSLMTILLLKIVDTPKAAQLYTTLLITPLLFTFSEVIPKNVFYYHADKLMLRFAPVLWFFHKLFTVTGAVWTLKIMSKLISHLMGSPETGTPVINLARRRHVHRLIYETHEEGLLSAVQNEMMSRLVNLPSIRLGSTMTDISHVVMLSVDSTAPALLKVLAAHDHEHYPVYRNSRKNIIGYINIYQALTSKQPFTNLTDFLKPIARLRTGISVTAALRQMRRDQLPIAIVIKGKPGIEHIKGVITTKDLIEEITGELV